MATYNINTTIRRMNDYHQIANVNYQDEVATHLTLTVARVTNNSDTAKTVEVQIQAGWGHTWYTVGSVSIPRRSYASISVNADLNGGEGYEIGISEEVYIKLVSECELTSGATTGTLTTAFERYIVSQHNTGGDGRLNFSPDRPRAGETVTVTIVPMTGWKLKSIGSTDASLAGSGNTRTFTMPHKNVSIDVAFDQILYTISKSATGGTLTTSKNSAYYQEQITLSATANAGWYFVRYETTGGTISGNKLTMPAANVTVTAVFAKTSYSITMKANPTAAGTASSSRATATVGDTATLSYTTNAGYHFTGWTTTGGSISGNTLTMPAANVTVTANFTQRSTPSLSTKSLTGGGTVNLTISAKSTAYRHVYRIYFGTGMDTGDVNVAAGVTSVSITIPESWSDAIPNATSKSQGWLRLWTYSGNTQISSSYAEITGLTYSVPAGVVPTMNNLVTELVKTYTENIYVQNHCQVRVTTTAAGARSSSITDMRITMSGYSGSEYNKTYTNSATGGMSLNHLSGNLTRAGSVTITVTATDSRGRTVTKTATITVSAYSPPSGTLDVWRVDAQGDADPNGEYGMYELTKSFTAVGNNQLTRTELTVSGTTDASPLDSGWLLNGGHIVFDILLEYEVTLTIADLYETTVIRDVLPSARFIIHVAADGNRIAFMKAVSQSVPAGKQYTFEISGDAEIYYGAMTLKQYIQAVLNGTI